MPGPRRHPAQEINERGLAGYPANSCVGQWGMERLDLDIDGTWVLKYAERMLYQGKSGQEFLSFLVFRDILNETTCLERGT